jgi:hypothetical protein
MEGGVLLVMKRKKKGERGKSIWTELHTKYTFTEIKEEEEKQSRVAIIAMAALDTPHFSPRKLERAQGNSQGRELFPS